MKYDCMKALDLIHEFHRLCWDSHSSGCDNDCPFDGMDNCNLDSFDEDKIALLQKWSDEHLEPPKLTREERVFLDGFYDNKGLAIQRVLKDTLFVRQHSPVSAYIDSILIDPSMFPFINGGEEWYFDKLLSLEVEDE